QVLVVRVHTCAARRGRRRRIRGGGRGGRRGRRGRRGSRSGRRREHTAEGERGHDGHRQPCNCKHARLSRHVASPSSVFTCPPGLFRGAAQGSRGRGV